MARLTLAEHFADLPDPRVERTRKHRLDDILVIALCAILCGATSFEDIEQFGECRKAWLRTFLRLPNGIPSHDTIYRVFCALDAKVFAACFARWVDELSATLGLKPIAIDGKSLRGARGDTFTGCVHRVSAWATEQGLILGQESVAEKSHEIAAIPILLRALHLNGAPVTIDAAGTQAGVVNAIRDGGGDYLLAVKGNQPTLHAAVRRVFSDACDRDFEGVTCTRHATVEGGHGRREERSATAIVAPPGLPAIWRDVAAVIQVNREREVDGKAVTTTHYYLTSLTGTAEGMAGLIRRHWAIENELHWVLDVTFREDANPTRNRNAAANLGIVRRTAISLLKQEGSKVSMPRKTFRAALEPEYLGKLLQGNAVI